MGFLYSQFFVTPAYPTQRLDGQTAIVTGSNTGLGKEAARHITRLGAANVILAVRNTKAGEDAKADIEKTTSCGAGVVEVWPLDLASYASVKAFAERAAKLPRLDILLENAGIATANFSTAEGHERTVTVNVISTFLLALLLLPKLKATVKQFKTEPRLTIVSSEVHGWTKYQEHEAKAANIFQALDDPNSPNMRERYPTSKLLEVLVVRQLAPRLAGSGVILNMLNPGLCHSELSRESGWALEVMKAVMARSTEVGSRTLVASALAGQESHGTYMSDGIVHDDQLSPFARSEEGRKGGVRVWEELSEILEEIQPGVTRNI